MRIKRIAALFLVICCILSGCGDKTGSSHEPTESMLAAVPMHPSKTLLVGRWEGTGYFDSLTKRGVECVYILDFFQDGSMSISSDNLYFYGVEVEGAAIHDGIVEFSIPYINPSIREEELPQQFRESLRISMTLQISREELSGRAKQGDWGIDIKFKRTMQEPRSYQETDRLSTQQMAEDFMLLCGILEAKHPDAYFTQSQEEYEKRKAALMTMLPTLDKMGFYFELRRFAASLRDGSTYVLPTAAMTDDTMLLPLRIEYLSGNWYIVSAQNEYQALLGKYITAINDIPIDEVFEKISEYNAYENDTYAQALFADSVVNADLLEYCEVIEEDQAIITINGNERVVVSAVKKAEIDKRNSLKIGVPSETKHHSGVNYMYKSLDNDILYIQYNSCIEMSDFPISQFKDELSSELESNKYEKLVIDLRYNSRGDSALMDSFIQPILKARDNGSRLYCLIGGKTYSGAFGNAVSLDKEGAVLVGQPTGGNMQHFTDALRFELPNSRFSGQHAASYLSFDENASQTSLLPDKLIEHTIDAYINGIDEEMEYIKKH